MFIAVFDYSASTKMGSQISTIDINFYYYEIFAAAQGNKPGSTVAKMPKVGQ